MKILFFLSVWGLEVLHETHRARALFSAPAVERFLIERPQLKLVADCSHWCCVHESLLAEGTTNNRLGTCPTHEENHPTLHSGN